MIKKPTNKKIKKTAKTTKGVKSTTKKTNKKMGAKKPAKKVTKKLAIKKVKAAPKKMAKKVVVKTNAKQIKSVKISSANVQTKKEKLIGIVSHYFDKINVAAIKLTAPLKVGDKILFRDHNGNLFEQKITSMQINRQGISSARKGDEIGIKVNGRVHEGNKVYLVE